MGSPRAADAAAHGSMEAASMKLFYRCQLCCPEQSRDVDVADADPRLSDAALAIAAHHSETSPDCPLNSWPWRSVEHFLIRGVQ